MKIDIFDQIELPNEEISELGDDARQCPHHNLHGSVHWLQKAAAGYWSCLAGRRIARWDGKAQLKIDRELEGYKNQTTASGQSLSTSQVWTFGH